MKYIQSGSNPSYPKEIITWTWGSKVPEWLSDISKVSFIDGNGNITLEYRDTSTGGVEIISSNGLDVLVRLNSKSDLICKSTDLLGDKPFVLSKVQLDLLYKPIIYK